MKLSSRDTFLERLLFVNIFGLYGFEEMSFGIVFKLIMILLIIVGLNIEVPKIKIKFNGVILCSLLFMIYTFFMEEYLQGEWTKLLGVNVQTAISIMIATLAFVVVYLYANTEYKRARLWHCFNFAGIALAIVVVFLVGGRVLHGLHHDDDIAYTLISHGLHSNKIGFCFGISFLTSLYCWDKNKSKMSMFVLLINAIFLFLSGSRRALIFMIIGPAIYYVAGEGKKSIFRLFIALAFIIMAYFAVMTIPYLYNSVGKRIESLIDVMGGGKGTDSTGTRYLMIEYGFELFMKNIWFGLGLNAFSYYFQDVIGKWIYAHNNYIELLVSGGIVYTAIYYSKFVFLLNKLKGKMRNNREMRIYFSIIVSLLIADVADVTYYYRIYYVMLAIIAAGVYGQYRKNEIILKNNCKS